MAVGVGAGELRELTDEELITKLRESKEELFNLRFQTATGQLTNNHRLRTVRQEIARTVREDETLPGTPVGALRGDRHGEVTRRAQALAF